MNSEFPDYLLSLMSQLKIVRDEQEGEEEAEEAEEWYNQFPEEGLVVDDSDSDQDSDYYYEGPFWGKGAGYDFQSECAV